MIVIIGNITYTFINIKLTNIIIKIKLKIVNKLTISIKY